MLENLMPRATVSARLDQAHTTSVDLQTQGKPNEMELRGQVSALMHTKYGQLLRLIRNKVGDRELAADLLNEAVTLALEHLRSGRPIRLEQLPGYIFKVSMHLQRNYRRNLDNRASVRADATAFETVAAPEQRDDGDDERLKQLTREVLASLDSPRDREAIRRLYLEEHDKEAICHDLGLGSLQFNQVVSRARRRMKELLETMGLSRQDLLCLLVGMAFEVGAATLLATQELLK